MRSSERDFVPINEASTDKVRFDIDLPPYIDRTLIRANTPRIESWMRLGGINHLRIESFEGERIEESPMIVGFDEQGNAYAGKGGSATIDEFEVNSEGVRQVGSPTVDTVIKLEVGQISNILSRENARSTKGWAGKLDEGISQGVRKASNKSLLELNSKSELQIFVGVAMGGTLGSQAFSGDIDSSTFIGILGACSMVGYGKVIFNRISDANFRGSIFLGPQLDRAALLQVKTRLQKVVKSTEQLEK